MDLANLTAGGGTRAGSVRAQRWSRGNGWITIALTDTIAALPAADANRAHYISLLNAMFAKLKATQQSGGYWTADVDHPAAFPAPESSGTSGVRRRQPAARLRRTRSNQGSASRSVTNPAWQHGQSPALPRARVTGALCRTLGEGT